MANEKRLIEYINREEVCKLCDNKKEFCGKEKCPVYKAPTVDAVEVVRCKDCKHFYHSVSSDRDGRCVQFGTYDTDPSVYLNDFCSYGERREGE